MKIQPIFLYFFCKDEYLLDLNISPTDEINKNTEKLLYSVLYYGYTDEKKGLLRKGTKMTEEFRERFKFILDNIEFIESQLPKLSFKEYKTTLIELWEDQITEFIRKSRTAKRKADGESIQKWIAKQKDIVLEKTTKSEIKKYRKFDDYLSQEAIDINLISKISNRYRNLEKPEHYYYLIYALYQLKYFVPIPKTLKYQTLHKALIYAFGDIGTRMAFRDGILKLHGNHNANVKSLINKTAEEIQNLLK